MTSGSPPSYGWGGGGGGGTNAVGGNGGNGAIELIYSSGTTPSNVVVRFLLHVPASTLSDNTRLIQVQTTGGVYDMSLYYRTGSSGKLEMKDATGSKFDSTPGLNPIDGQAIMVSMELAKSGSNVAWKLATLVPDESTGGAVSFVNGTFAGTMSSVADVIINPAAAALGATAIGHLTVQYALTDLLDLNDPILGYAGELAGTRFLRLCSEEGITASLAGNASDTAAMGPQSDEQLITLLQECEDVDRGLIYEPRDSFGLAYRTLTDLQNQSPAVTADYTAAVLSNPLQPTYDDQLSKNDVTVARVKGSSNRVVQSTGSMSTQDPPNGIGTYSYSVTVNCDTDTQTLGIAQWILGLGTVDEYRYPSIPFDLTRRELRDLFPALQGMDVGDYLQIINPPSFLTSAISQLTFGFSETINAYTYEITFNCVPELPYNV